MPGAMAEAKTLLASSFWISQQQVCVYVHPRRVYSQCRRPDSCAMEVVRRKVSSTFLQFAYTCPLLWILIELDTNIECSQVRARGVLSSDG